MIDATHFFQAAGNIVPLNVWAPDDIVSQLKELHNDTSKHAMSRNEGETNDHNSSKSSGIDLKEVPANWGIPLHAGTCGSITYNKGDYLSPHRDKWRYLLSDGSFSELAKGNGVRLFNFTNANSTTEFTFIYEGKVVYLEPRRWYAVNTQRVHWGFSFVDGVYHMGCELKFNDTDRAATTKFLLENMEYAQPLADRKGVDCTRN
tara:strand:+ start:50 stop:661 length:612 start_codon:yes stop_codon:yes gene_type:complete